MLSNDRVNEPLPCSVVRHLSALSTKTRWRDQQVVHSIRQHVAMPHQTPRSNTKHKRQATTPVVAVRVVVVVAA